MNPCASSNIAGKPDAAFSSGAVVFRLQVLYNQIRIRRTDVSQGDDATEQLMTSMTVGTMI